MSNARGNAFLYILIAIALFAGLTFVLSRAQDGGEQSQMTKASVQTRAQRLLSYVDSVSQAWFQIKNSGTDLDNVSLVLPSAGTFNDAPTVHKLFHPDGGGVQYKDMNEDAFRASLAAPVGWKFVLVNADFSPTSGTDLIMTYLNISTELCAKINEITRNDSAIPTVTVNFTNTFINGSTPLQEAQCAECKTHSSLCVQNGGVNAFYNMIEAR